MQVQCGLRNKLKDIIKIEAIQRRATKLVSEIRDRKYPDRLKLLNLTTLEYRRIRADVIQVYKIFSGIDDLNPNCLFKVTQNSITRGHKFKIDKQRCRLNLRANFFTNIPTVVNFWNTLPDDVVNSPNVKFNTFKNRFEKLNTENLLKYTPSFMQVLFK